MLTITVYYRSTSIEGQLFYVAAGLTTGAVVGIGYAAKCLNGVPITPTIPKIALAAGIVCCIIGGFAGYKAH